jgi:hypothetical protein
MTCIYGTIEELQGGHATGFLADLRCAHVMGTDGEARFIP